MKAQSSGFHGVTTREVGSVLRRRDRKLNSQSVLFHETSCKCYDVLHHLKRGSDAHTRTRRSATTTTVFSTPKLPVCEETFTGTNENDLTFEILEIEIGDRQRLEAKVVEVAVECSQTQHVKISYERHLLRHPDVPRP
ncbi:uncharacterized protein Bfra_011870 [Botrytis fragariae]|uniref:Uncharacterized protein n=1 Tax=Botrytis fragariae TaxID=1964551 RepID=A0A8H6EEG6_9HELO|nr:uncharacterized protein Bfra_011870 [Botrytis fragariae]KAF5868905.1 hypothetical protein Bfra_011870 [Botrytis fragariae]